jgi:hypothetical protein
MIVVMRSIGSNMRLNRHVAGSVVRSVSLTHSWALLQMMGELMLMWHRLVRHHVSVASHDGRIVWDLVKHIGQGAILVGAANIPSWSGPIWLRDASVWLEVFPLAIIVRVLLHFTHGIETFRGINVLL